MSAALPWQRCPLTQRCVRYHCCGNASHSPTLTWLPAAALSEVVPVATQRLTAERARGSPLDRYFIITHNGVVLIMATCFRPLLVELFFSLRLNLKSNITPAPCYPFPYSSRGCCIIIGIHSVTANADISCAPFPQSKSEPRVPEMPLFIIIY